MVAAHRRSGPPGCCPCPPHRGSAGSQWGICRGGWERRMRACSGKLGMRGPRVRPASKPDQGSRPTSVVENPWPHSRSPHHPHPWSFCPHCGLSECFPHLVPGSCCSSPPAGSSRRPHITEPCASSVLHQHWRLDLGPPGQSQVTSTLDLQNGLVGCPCSPRSFPFWA